MNAGRILKLAGQSYINNLAEQHRKAAIETLNAVLAAAESFNEELAAVAANTKLSPEGRAESNAKVAADALTKLATVATIIKTLTDRAASLEQSLLRKATPPPPTDLAERLAYELRLQEIRTQLRELPASERANVYRTATDPLVLAAIETGTIALSAIRPDGSRRLEEFVDADQMVAAKLESSGCGPCYRYHAA